MNIYTVREEMLNILTNIDTLHEELDEIRSLNDSERSYDDEEALEKQIDAYEDTIESLEWDLSEVVEEIVKDIKNLTCDANAFCNQKNEFAAKERWAKDCIERRKEILNWFMKMNGERKVKTELWNVSIQKNGGLRGIEVNCKPEDLPERFRQTKIEYTLDQIEARQALDAGEQGLPFQYRPQGEHIVIR